MVIYNEIYHSWGASANMQTAKIRKFNPQISFPEVRIISKELITKMEIITVGSNLQIILINSSLMVPNDHFFHSAHCLFIYMCSQNWKKKTKGHCLERNSPYKGTSKLEILLVKIFSLKQKLNQMLPANIKKTAYVPSDLTSSFM